MPPLTLDLGNRMSHFASAKISAEMVANFKKPLVDIVYKRGGSLVSIIRSLITAYRYLTGSLEEPTIENTDHPNSHNLIRIRDRFFTLEENPGRYRLFRLLFNLVIWHYEHSSYYARRLDVLLEWLTELVISGEWIPRPPNTPKIICWKEHRRPGLTQADMVGGIFLKNARKTMETTTLIQENETCKCGGIISITGTLEHTNLKSGICPDCRKEYTVYREG